MKAYFAELHQGIVAAGLTRIYVSTAIQEEPNQVEIALAARKEKGRPTIPLGFLADNIGISTALDQQREHLWALGAAMCGEDQRRNIRI